MELLVDQINAEQLKIERKEEIKKMNEMMDLKLAKVKADKLKNIESKLISESLDSNEHYSGILIKKGTRIMKTEQLDLLVKDRKFVPIENIDILIDNNGQYKNSALAFFTIGVIANMTKPCLSAKEKVFSRMTVTDLQKYDMQRVKVVLEKNYAKDPEALKLALMSFNKSGYKEMKFMLFGDAAKDIHSKVKVGSIVCLVNPKSLKINNTEKN